MAKGARWNQVAKIERQFLRKPMGFYAFIVGLAFSLLVAATVRSSILPHADDVRVVQWAGLGLHLAAFGMVAWGIGQIRRAFGVSPLTHDVLRWFRNIPKAVQKPRAVSGSGTSGTISAAVGATGEGKMPRSATLQDRITDLENRVDKLHDRLGAIKKQQEQDRNDARKQINEERAKRARQIDKMSELLIQVNLGGHHLEAVALAWFVVGAIFTAIPQAVAPALRWAIL